MNTSMDIGSVKFIYFTDEVYIHMNHRKLLLGNLAWCPGVKAASRFIPDKELPKRLVIMRMTGGILGFLLLGVMLVGVPVPARPPFIDLVKETDQENYSVGDDVAIDFRIVNRMPFTIQLSPFSYREIATYKAESGKRLNRALDDIPPKEGESGIILWPFSNTIIDSRLGLPEWPRGEYAVIINIDGYEVSRTFQIR